MITRNLVYISLVLPLLGCVKPPERNAVKKTSAASQAPVPGADGTASQSPTDASAPPATNTPPEPAATVVSYPQPDPEVGEKMWPKEVESAAEIVKIIEGQINEKKKSGANPRALRDAHPKQHGCVRATFEVDPQIDPSLAHGVFAKGSKFDAVVRYSNSSHKWQNSDLEKDGRGMAIKLFGVPGKKLLDIEPDATTQDFVLISHPTFFVKDPATYVEFIRHVETAPAKLITILGPFSGFPIALAITTQKPVASPFEPKYHSTVPYQLGVGAAKKAVKYRAKSCGTNEDNEVNSAAEYKNGKYNVPTSDKDPNYLRTRLIEHFKVSDACVDMFVQVREKESMDVEDSLVEWKTEWKKVARLTMKKEGQDIAPTPDFNDPRNKFCDNLSFNPWHSLPEHKPLGSMNRMRKVVYEQISKHRHTVNGEARKEPTEFKVQ